MTARTCEHCETARGIRDLSREGPIAKRITIAAVWCRIHEQRDHEVAKRFESANSERTCG